jgi:outer membrane protein OmpA-like peptidoglycan-associated protein
MTMKRHLVAWLMPVALASGSMLGSENDFRSLSDIEAALDPLEFAADYDGVRVSIDLTIHFDFDSARIKPESKAQLDALGQALTGERLGACRFKVIGHTDGVGSAAYNQLLSERRANAVITALINQYGVNPEQLVSQGKGYSQPKPGLASDAPRHRRVEVQTIRCQDQREPGTDDQDDGLGGIRVDG